MGATVAFWVIAAIVMALLEAATVSLVSIWFAIGALGAAIGAALGANIVWQVVIFVVLSAMALAVTKPLVKKFRKKGAALTNADRIIGERGEVIETIDPISGSGQIRVLGQVWSAKGEGGNAILPGAFVSVERIEGVKAVVKEVKQEGETL